jgi:imidazolonepropionase-like amidohydrolase
VTTPGGHCHYLGGAVRGVEGIRVAVRERVERGVDVVKVMASGGMNTPGSDVAATQFSTNDLRVLVELAREAGLPVVAHAHAASAVRQAVEVGVDGIEHASHLEAGLPPDRQLGATQTVYASDEELERLAGSGIVVCPTLGGNTVESYSLAPPRMLAMMRDYGVTPASLVEERRRLLNRMNRAGVTFISGSDAGIAPNKAHGRSVEAVIELAAVTGTESAVTAATSTAALACGLDGRTGRLKAGYDADLLIVDGDLRTAVTALRAVHMVMVQGQPFP